MMVLTQVAFDALLHSLSPDRDQAASRYLEVRKNLVRLFEWRGCPTPDEYADEALNRCARKIADGEQIRDVATYAVGVARLLLKEMAVALRKEAPLESAPEPRTLPVEVVEQDLRTDCLRNCLSTLSADNRDLILTYYSGEKSEKINNRKRLMDHFGLTHGNLRMKALRLRTILQSCTENCAERASVTI